MRRQATPLALPPLVDALDDEEMLARADVAECARFAREGGERRRRAELPFQLRLLVAELLHRSRPLRLLVPRVDVGLERAVVQQRDEDEHSHRDPAAKHGRARRTTARHAPRLRPEPVTSL
jgi:hypothetical protein